MLISQIFLFDSDEGDLKTLIMFKNSVEYSDFNECIDKVKTKFPDSWTWDDMLSEITDTFEVENIIHIQECETYGL